MEFDGNNEIPYPLRSVHPLHEIGGEGELPVAAVKARRIAESGCFGAAADKYAKLAEQRPDHPGLRANVALCRMWDGAHKAAAAAFRLAAGAERDFETAAEYEALAQLLSLTEEGGGQVTLKDVAYTAESVSGLLSELDGRPAFHRLPIPDDEERPARLSAVYEILDRPLPEPTADDAAELSADAIPRVVGEVTVLDGGDGDPPRAILSAFEGDELTAARAALDGVPGLGEGEQAPDEIENYSLPAEMFGLRWRWSFPKAVPQRRRRAMEQAEWHRRVAEVWPDTPLSALGGKTPAAGEGGRRAAGPAGRGAVRAGRRLRPRPVRTGPERAAGGVRPAADRAGAGRRGRPRGRLLRDPPVPHGGEGPDRPAVAHGAQPRPAGAHLPLPAGRADRGARPPPPSGRRPTPARPTRRWSTSPATGSTMTRRSACWTRAASSRRGSRTTSRRCSAGTPANWRCGWKTPPT